jgi:hypothetical protein
MPGCGACRFDKDGHTLSISHETKKNMHQDECNRKALAREHENITAVIAKLFRVLSKDDAQCVFSHPYVVGRVTWQCCLEPPFDQPQIFAVWEKKLRPCIWTMHLEFGGRRLTRNYDAYKCFSDDWNTHKVIVVCIRNLVRDMYDQALAVRHAGADLVDDRACVETQMSLETSP